MLLPNAIIDKQRELGVWSEKNGKSDRKALSHS